METNTTPKNGFWIMIEEPQLDENVSAESNQPKESETFRDTYDFYPDSGF